MCSIYGVLFREEKGPTWEVPLRLISERAKDRGRDGGRQVKYDLLTTNMTAVLGNWRAAPTPEMERAPLQPYDGVVHNGTIANDMELGILDDEVDSMVLPRILDPSTLEAFVHSLEQIKGSYAIAMAANGTVYLACNFKPIHYWEGPGDARYFSSLASHFEDVMPFGQAPVALKPYTAMDLRTGRVMEIPRKTAKRALVVASGGLDSTVVATHYAALGYDVCLLHMDYGCHAAKREAKCIPLIAQNLYQQFNVQVQWEIMPLPYAHIGGSTLLRAGAEIAGPVAGAEFAHEWVPARNLVMVGYATAYAEAHGYHIVALGNNLEESGAYPDNEEQMFLYLDKVADYAVSAGYELRIEAPVCKMVKREIVQYGLDLGAPLEHTWSCYKGGDVHCGKCGPCFMRRTAFERCGKTDPVFKEEA